MGRVTDIEQIRKIVLDAITFPAGGYLTDAVTETVVQSNEQTRFLVIRTGWENGENAYGIIQDIELKDNTVLIHQDNTDYDLADDLIQAGIPASFIVKTYVAPENRVTHPLNS